MWRKIALAGATAAVIIGAGGAALATSGTTVAGSPGAPAASAAPAAPGTSGTSGHGRHAGLRAERHVLHGQFVTRARGSASTYVTHTVIRGSVTAVSATSLTVRAVDGVTQTFTVNGKTVVHRRGTAKGTNAGIGAVTTGAQVFVAGTGTDPVTATHVLLAAK